MEKASLEDALLPKSPSVSDEVKRQLRLAGPLIAGSLLQNLIQMISVMFVGHLGELPLAGASLASSFAAVTGFSLLLGMASALDTLCGQAFGARQYHLLGIYKQRAMLILTLASVPLAVVWFYTGDILLLFGQDADIAAEAGAFARWMIPALFAYGLLQCHVRFLQTQNVVVPVMACAGAAAACHVPVCWALVHGLGLGAKGAALGNAVSYWVNVAALAVYVRASPNCKKTWTGFSVEAFRDALGFLRLAVPSALMVCLEWWLLTRKRAANTSMQTCNPQTCNLRRRLRKTNERLPGRDPVGAGATWVVLASAGQLERLQSPSRRRKNRN